MLEEGVYAESEMQQLISTSYVSISLTEILAEILSLAPMEVISGMGEFYSKADSNTKIKLLGSIFPEMLEFDGNKCRTTKVNEALALCLSIDKAFSKKKTDTPTKIGSIRLGG
ncbi:MAG: hypothetical protein JKX84_08950, partial [Flavobacteriales bacterium]|nr:hypothetical protein [Flavobacteriales bacterium]